MPIVDTRVNIPATNRRAKEGAMMTKHIYSISLAVFTTPAPQQPGSIALANLTELVNSKTFSLTLHSSNTESNRLRSHAARDV